MFLLLYFWESYFLNGFWGITINILTYKLVQINANLEISIIYRHLKYIPFLPTSLCYYYKLHLYISPLTVLLYCLMKLYFKSDRRKELQTKIHCTAFYIYLGIYLYQCSVFFMWLKITSSVFSIWRIHFMIFMGGVRSTSHEWILCVSLSKTSLLLHQFWRRVLSYSEFFVKYVFLSASWITSGHYGFEWEVSYSSYWVSFTWYTIIYCCFQDSLHCLSLLTVSVWCM